MNKVTVKSSDVVINRRQVRVLCTPDDECRLDVHPLINNVLWNRGIRSLDDIDYRLEKLLPMDDLKQLPEAIELLYQAITQQKKVVVVGDFDSDGMTSTALAVLALQELGLESVDYFIPNRFDHGYGLTAVAVELVLSRFEPDLIITVDNGIVNYEGVQLAKDAGVQVLITDHHLANAELPVADAIVNPNQQDDAFGSKHLTGVGVILYLMLAFRKTLRLRGWFSTSGRREPNLAQYLDLVAIGTMADAAVLDYNNRLLVHEGVRRIRSGKTRLGILTILELARRDYSQVCSEDLTFVIAPRLNAAGRLSDAELVVKLLTTVSKPRAQKLANQLEQLNNERKRLSKEMERQAIEMVDEMRRSGERNESALVLYRERWHQGINGIVAARIKEHFAVPTIVFSDSKDGSLKGSARSVDGFDIRESFVQLSQQEPDLIDYFGGHAMAAGISIKLSKLAHFTELWRELVRRTIGAEDDRYVGVIEVDDYLSTDYLNLDTAKLIRQLGPWGNGFVEPSFYGYFLVEGVDRIGDSHLKLRLRLADSEQFFEAVVFGSTKQQRLVLQPANWVHIIFKLAVNNYGGCDRLQLVVLEVKTDG